MRFERCFGCMEKTQDPDGICPHCGFDAAHYAEAEYVLRPGTILQGRYVVGKLLGKGGFGITYIGYDMSLDIRVAIKEYYPEGLVGRNAKQSSELIWYSSKTDARHAKNSRESLLKEARSMAKIDSFQTVARVRDVFMANETAYLVMDYIDGVTLKKEVMERGILNYDRMRTYLLPIMRDLAEIHEAGIIHRDISPDNIMLEPSGKVRLLDLGAAKDLYKTAAASGEDVPESTQMVLKHGFSPLEQYKMHGDIGPWTDVYALTATIYYLVSGRVLPTPMDRLDEEPEKMVQDMISRLSMPEKAKEGMRKGLAILKKDRIKSMRELAEYFTEAAPQPAPKPQPQPQPQPKPQPQPEPKPVSEPKREAQPESKMQSEPRAAAKPQLAPEEQFKPPLEMKVDRGDDFKKGIVLFVGGILLVGVGLGLRSADKKNGIPTAKVQTEKKGTNRSITEDAKETTVYAEDYEETQEYTGDYKSTVEANETDVEEILNLATAYMLGDGVSKDYKKAAELYQQAADVGNTDAKFLLGLLYERGVGVTQDYKRAAELYQQAANAGNADAMDGLGWLYEAGEGVEQDYKKAAELYQQAANAGNADAMDGLGRLYEAGEGVEQDYKKAAEWYQKAAEAGNAAAMNNLGALYGSGNGVEQNYKKALKWYQKAAEAGDAAAMCNLGGLYLKGNGADQNYEKAAEWYQKAAEAGSAAAMNNLGVLYEGGNGVEQSYEKAIEWYTQAAEAGVAVAMNTLGELYENGKGVEQNYEKAIEWYKLALEHGYSSAQESVERVQQALQNANGN